MSEAGQGRIKKSLYKKTQISTNMQTHGLPTKKREIIHEDSEVMFR